jgi:hypothetical protein
MAFGRDANVRWIRAEESENVSAMLDTTSNKEPGELDSEPVAGKSRHTGSVAIWSPASERVARKSQVILHSGFGPKSGPDQSKERRNRYAQIVPFWRWLLKMNRSRGDIQARGTMAPKLPS